MALLVMMTIAALMLLAALVMVFGLMFYAASRATRQVNACWQCGYNLSGRGESRHCPECGHPFMIDANGDAISTGSQRTG